MVHPAPAHHPRLHDRFPALESTLPFLPLGHAPTPVRRLPDPAPGTALWCKDESGYGDGGWGGNKVRKLEWLLPDARRRGARTLLTVGGIGTNWGLAAALYAREQGMATALALIDQPVDDHVRAQLERLRRSGATLHFTRTKLRTMATAPWLFLRHTTAGRLPHYLPAGGSTPVGTLGPVEVALELADQIAAGALPEPSHLVTAVGSGGTAAGLALGLRLAGLRTRVVGVVVNDTLRLDMPAVTGLARGTAHLLRSRGAGLPPTSIGPEQLTLVRHWLGPGYGHPTPEALRARRLAADTASLLLEPVYTAKAMAALTSLAADGRLAPGPALFLNTHGPRPR
ncbi:1-aminocyclopropane-1-carboxylate deaminase/D-cysteine desulfhydrase [Streptomyces sp. NEAU-Y11]|uniref:1-aminocyclopropane-1-carboxylate deaminase/D-cysteine desulfhydrase n=1 Tax=Streptomyces cucumeris TaxID=2962890 RepID=UPI0020C908DD|nr:pyridoxal-phosphate dependent enzyme [Streptomyces sp. NEAU-Y11]MCP9212302.1 pyridoxal-phosphate dependent enzyme [Streptomyces sp. NEAU-Y11]